MLQKIDQPSCVTCISHDYTKPFITPRTTAKYFAVTIWKKNVFLYGRFVGKMLVGPREKREFPRIGAPPSMAALAVCGSGEQRNTFFTTLKNIE